MSTFEAPPDTNTTSPATNTTSAPPPPPPDTNTTSPATNTTSAPPPPPPQPSASPNLSVGLIVGIVIVGLFIIVLLGLVYIRFRKRRREHEYNSPPPKGGRGRPNLDWPTRLKIALGAAKGLAYLHEDCHPKIIHRDIKATNILLDSNFEAKVADFGLAKFFPDANTHISTRVMGTFGYLDPDYASSGKLTDKSDVFSFGVMLLELITGRQPIDYSQSSTGDRLVDWARPLLTRALEEGNFDALVDHRLRKDYNHNEMIRMVSCADSCASHSAQYRPRMSQVVRALEGNLSLSDLCAEIRPRHNTAYSSHGSSDYDTNQYSEDLKKFKKVALGTQEYGSSEQSRPTSEYGSPPSGSSIVAQQSTQ